MVCDMPYCDDPPQPKQRPALVIGWDSGSCIAVICESGQQDLAS